MKGWYSLKIDYNNTVKACMEKLESNISHILLVTENNDFLVGTVSDGDIRRWILNGGDVNDPLSCCMNKSPKFLKNDFDFNHAYSLMKEYKIQHVPIVNSNNQIVGLHCLEEIISPDAKPNTVFILAGGRGSRMGDLTQNIPKPMLNIGGRPILETIVENFVNQGFSDLIISINYLGYKIKDHFGSGCFFNANITYVEEDRPLGTAGSLSLINKELEAPIIVVNGDLLTNIDFADIVDKHSQNEAFATMGVREFFSEIPFGVIEESDGKIMKIEEKPLIKYLINAGVYVLNPECLSYVEYNNYLDMTNLFAKLISDKKFVFSHVIHGYWRDIGRVSEYDLANQEIKRAGLRSLNN